MVRQQAWFCQRSMGYETRRRTKNLSPFGVFSVEQCFKDFYPRNMTICINKVFVKILTAGELFSSLPFGLIIKEAEMEKTSAEQ